MDGELRCEDPAGSAPLEARLAGELPRLRAYLGRVAGRRGDVDDLVQECVARALRLGASYDRRRALWPWLKQTALRVLLDQREREGRAPRTALVDEPASWDRDALAQRDEVARLLARLAPIERDVLVRFHARGESVAAIGAALALPEGTVKSHLHRARRRLAQETRDDD
ncbi:MAG: RNA polymerase sigma factor [Planctomycetes bacterium]|nr:RNA polymerase sigma factor [Planctomycetota bacterium]